MTGRLISVRREDRQIDITVPDDLEVRRLVPVITDLFLGDTDGGSREPGDGGADTDAGAARERALVRVGGERLLPHRGLAANGVYDGDLLLLVDAERPLPPPLFDDLAEALADDSIRTARAWSPSRRPALLFAGTAATTTAIAVTIRRWADPSTPGLPLLALGILLAVLAVVVARGAGETGRALALAALPPLAVGAAASVPGVWSQDPATPLLVGCTVGGVAASLAATFLGSRGISASALLAAAVLAGGIAAGIALAVPLGGGVGRIGAATAAIAVVGLTAAPRAVIAIAGIDLPRVPAVGGELALLDDADSPTDALSSPDEATAPATVAHRSRDAAGRMHDVTAGWYGGCAALGLVGVLALGAAVAPAGLELTTPTPGIPAPPAPAVLALACVVTLTLFLRSRHVEDAAPAALLLAAAAVPAPAAVAAVTLGSPALTPYATAALAVLVGAALALALAPRRHPVGPGWRRAGELIEAVLTASVLPLTLAALGVFSLVRAW